MPRKTILLFILLTAATAFHAHAGPKESRPHEATGQNPEHDLLDKGEINPWRFQAGSGLSIVSYRQKSMVPFSETAIAATGGANYQVTPEKFDLGVTFFLSGLPVATSSPLGLDLKYLEINGKVGWAVIPGPSEVQLVLNAGVLYCTSFGDVGFTNIYGPQLSFDVLHPFAKGSALRFSGKIAPTFIPDLDYREIAFGMHYSFPVSFAKRVSIGLDVSQLNLFNSEDWALLNVYGLAGGVEF